MMEHKADHIELLCVGCEKEWPCPTARRLAKIEYVVDRALQSDAGEES